MEKEEVTRGRSERGKEETHTGEVEDEQEGGLENQLSDEFFGLEESCEKNTAPLMPRSIADDMMGNDEEGKGKRRMNE